MENSRVDVAIVEVNNIGTLIRPDLSNFRQLIVPSTKEKKSIKSVTGVRLGFNFKNLRCVNHHTRTPSLARFPTNVIPTYAMFWQLVGEFALVEYEANFNPKIMVIQRTFVGKDR